MFRRIALKFRSFVRKQLLKWLPRIGDRLDFFQEFIMRPAIDGMVIYLFLRALGG